jgi:hypothetical protein
MASGGPNYLKAAFANVYNLSLLGGSLVASLATDNYLLGAVTLGLEALWLLFAPDTTPFKRRVDRMHRAQTEEVERARIAKLIETLPKDEWRRAHSLGELKIAIEADMQHNPSFQAILLQTEIDKLSQLHASFVSLAAASVRAETYLSATDIGELKGQVKQQQAIATNVQDAAARELGKKNVDVLERRLETIDQIYGFVERARGQMTLIENTVRLLRDQVLTMASPDQLNEQLDDLILGVEAIQSSAKDQELTLAHDPAAAVVPIAEEAPGSTPPRERAR